MSEKIRPGQLEQLRKDAERRAAIISTFTGMKNSLNPRDPDYRKKIKALDDKMYKNLNGLNRENGNY